MQAIDEVARPSTYAQADQEPANSQLAVWQALGERLAAVGDRPNKQAAPPAQGKWPIATRLAHLLDAGSPYLALSSLAGGTPLSVATSDPDQSAGRSPPTSTSSARFGGPDEPAKHAAPLGQPVGDDCRDGAGIATGIGRICGVLCMVIANDWQHKAGSYQPATLQKHLRAQSIAERERLPCVYLVDSAGIYLPKQAELFAGQQHFGRMFLNQARMSAQGIPQVAVVLGMCTAGGAYVPAMADETILVAGQGTIFLAGPALVEAATGERVDAQALGGADLHAKQSGLVDHVAEDEAEAFLLCRDIVAALGPKTDRRQAACAGVVARTPQPPKQRAEELASLLPIDLRQPLPMLAVIARLVDDSAWHPFKPLYGPSLLCGFAYLEGQRIGIVANDGLLDGPAAQKGAHFVGLCDQRETPLLFLQHTTGFLVGRAAEAGGIAKDGAKMVQAVAAARVPKLTLLVGASHGAGNYAMCGRGLEPNFLFAWPSSRISVMGPSQAAQTMVSLLRRKAERRGEAWDEQAEQTQMAPLVARYTHEASALYATSQLWDDGLLLPSETRRTLALALASCRRPHGGLPELPVTRH